MSDTGWTPIHHEEAEDPEPAQAPRHEPETRRRSAPAEKETMPMGIPIPMGMSLIVPPDLIAAISSLSGTQADLVMKIDRIEDAITELVEAINTGLASHSKDGVTAQADFAKKMSDLIEQMHDRADEQAQAFATVVDGLKSQMSDLQTAIVAPRYVSLERDKDGIATGAVSEVKPA